MFETLMSKTFTLLSASLLFAYLGCLFSQNIFAKFLEIQDYSKIKTYNIIAIVINIIAFIVLMFTRKYMPWNMIFMGVFTFSSGFTLGLITLVYGDIAKKALSITVLTTFLTSMIAMYSGLDFAWLGKILFWALLGLIVVSIIGLFIKMKGKRIFAFFGVLIFTGYLLYDFSALSKAKQIATANNWETALDFAINIYLDIVNLFIQLMHLMSSNN